MIALMMLREIVFEVNLHFEPLAIPIHVSLREHHWCVATLGTEGRLQSHTPLNSSASAPGFAGVIGLLVVWL
jgi:hypothetical protein